MSVLILTINRSDVAAVTPSKAIPGWHGIYSQLLNAFIAHYPEISLLPAIV